VKPQRPQRKRKAVLWHIDLFGISGIYSGTLFQPLVTWHVRSSHLEGYVVTHRSRATREQLDTSQYHRDLLGVAEGGRVLGPESGCLFDLQNCFPTRSPGAGLDGPQGVPPCHDTSSARSQWLLAGLEVRSVTPAPLASGVQCPLQFLRGIGPQRANAPLELPPCDDGQRESAKIARLKEAEIGDLCADQWRQGTSLCRQWESEAQGPDVPAAKRCPGQSLGP
jgi:hypothetical protein